MEPCTFWPQPPIYFPKKPALKKFLILSQESPSFSGYRNLEKILVSRNGTLYTSEKGTFLYFGKDIPRTLAHLKLEAYLEP